MTNAILFAMIFNEICYGIAAHEGILDTGRRNKRPHNIVEFRDKDHNALFFFSFVSRGHATIFRFFIC